MPSLAKTDLFGQQPITIKHPDAYAGQPGRGPEGKACQDCEHYCRVEYHGRVYLKCGKIEFRWTHGEGTDIKASTPACQFFEARARVSKGAVR